jgi:hypothetical protein
MSDNFSDQIARLQQERLADQWEAKKQEATDEAEYIGSLQTQIRDYMQSGDKESAKNLLGELETSQKRYADLAQELQPPQQIHPAQAEVLGKYHDQLQHRHWCGLPAVSNLDVLVYADRQAQAQGHAPGSPEWKRIVEAAAPQAESPTLTPDEVVEMTRKSRYASDFSGRSYNANVRKIYEGR